MAETDLTVTYDGPALAEGRMPVRELAPALLALGDLFAEASKQEHPNRPPVALDIRATQEGSFILHLILEAEKGWDQVTDIFTSDSLQALLNLKEVVLGPLGLFAVIRWLKGRRVRARENVRAGHVKITLEDGETLEVPASVVRLIDRPPVRRGALEVVSPLTREGVSELRFDDGDEQSVRIEKDDLPAFEALPEEDALTENEIEMVVTIVAPVFQEGNKWRFSPGRGGATFYAAIDDPEFLARVDAGDETFAKGDSLLCRMLIAQFERDGTLHTEYRVVRVIRHIPRSQQLRLDAGDQ